MPERKLVGTPASPGIAVGTAWCPESAVGGQHRVAPDHRSRELGAALGALADAARSLLDLAEKMPSAEAEIVETGALMAEDAGLARTIEEAILVQGLTAPEAILRATEQHAAAIAAIGDETLAARAADVRSLGRRAARLSTGIRDELPATGSELILISRDLGPADVAEAADVLAGVVLAEGGATAHAAIVARSLGIPMVTGLGDSVLEVAAGTLLVLDGSSGAVMLDPSPASADLASVDMRARHVATRRAQELRDQPAVTTDGVTVSVLVNVATAEECEVGLRAGAEGIGLLRTELAFLEATNWPTERQHVQALTPILTELDGRRAVIRVLDFGADKSPPFLHGVAARGIELLLDHPDAFLAQLKAFLEVAKGRDVRILLPMVETLQQLSRAGALVEEAARSHGTQPIPALGAMIETPQAAANAVAIAGRCAFLSIGTNDLTATTLGVERFASNAGHAYDPKVLRSIARSIEAAHEAGIPIEVCGEAASDTIMLPLLVGLGIDEVSVGAARVGEVRGWIRKLDAAETAGLARSALTMDTAEEVEWATRPMAAALQTEAPATVA